jgi:hypothetical protein
MKTWVYFRQMHAPEFSGLLVKAPLSWFPALSFIIAEVERGITAVAVDVTRLLIWTVSP